MEGNVKPWSAVRMRRMMAYNRDSFGRVIQEAREMMGMSQKNLADMLHIGKSFVCNWESGFSRPDIELVPELCRVLNLSIHAFYGFPTEKRDLQKQEVYFLQDYMELEQEDRQMISTIMRKMITSEFTEMHAACMERFVQVLHFDSDDYFKPGHGGHLRWIRRSYDRACPDFLITVSGNSLTPEYADDDDLMGRKTSAISEGMMGVVLLDDELMVLKRQGSELTGFGGRVRVSCDDRARVSVVGEIMGKVTSEDLPSDKEQQVLSRWPRIRRGGKDTE